MLCMNDEQRQELWQREAAARVAKRLCDDIKKLASTLEEELAFAYVNIVDCGCDVRVIGNHPLQSHLTHFKEFLSLEAAEKNKSLAKLRETLHKVSGTSVPGYAKETDVQQACLELGRGIQSLSLRIREHVATSERLLQVSR